MQESYSFYIRLYALSPPLLPLLTFLYLIGIQRHPPHRGKGYGRLCSNMTRYFTMLHHFGSDLEQANIAKWIIIRWLTYLATYSPKPFLKSWTWAGPGPSLRVDQSLDRWVRSKYKHISCAYLVKYKVYMYTNHHLHKEGPSSFLTDDVSVTESKGLK